MTKQTKEVVPQPSSTIESRQKCGIVMPISACDTCSEQHWSEVKTIITDAIESVGFAAGLVSDADDVGIIQKRIIQNLYENPIVVCDVSGKNPNVMFELGMRLAFDKPTIIVKDDKTSYSFDTSPIEHLEYPRDLRFAKIVDFKKNLGEKVRATISRAETDSSYTTFLKHFGKFAVARLDTMEVSKEDYIIEELRELRRLVSRRDLNSEREYFRMLDREKHRVLVSDSGESVRRKKVREIIAEQVNKVINSNKSDKTFNSPSDFEALIYHEIINNHDIRALADSPAEVEELVHSTLRNIVG